MFSACKTCLFSLQISSYFNVFVCSKIGIQYSVYGFTVVDHYSQYVFCVSSKKITTWRPEELQKMSDQVIEKEEREKVCRIQLAVFETDP